MSQDELMRTVGALRRRMPRHIFFALSLSLLLLLGCACGPARAGEDWWEDSAPLFVSGRMTEHEYAKGEFVRTNVSSFDSLFLAAGSGVMVAFAEAQYAGGDEGEENVGIVARYIETGRRNWASKTIEKNEGKWKTQLALQRREGVGHSVLRSPTAVIKGDKIYLLALSNRTNNSSQSDQRWHFELAVGAIRGGVGSKSIEWGASASLHSKLTQVVKKEKLNVFPGSGQSAFLTSNETVVFSAHATNKKGEPGYAILQLKDYRKPWMVSFVERPKGCRLFSVFERKDKLISILSECPHGNTYVKEYDEISKGWKDAEDRPFHGWSSRRRLGGLTHVTVGNKGVVLFAEKCFVRYFADGARCIVFLRVTDGSRWESVGTIATQYGKAASGRFLCTNGGLYLLHHQNKEGKDAIVLTRLKQELETIKSVVNSWARRDTDLSRPCRKTAPEGASPDTLCVTPMPTDGLVGFLSDRSDNFVWHDEYELMSAWVSGRKVKNGYAFTGTGDGALWPLNLGYLSKWYDFTKCGLTLLATVFVHETPKGDSSLLTVDRSWSYERLGLWYKNGRWRVVSTNGKEGPAVKLRTQKEHRVALVLHNNTISVYVNGKSLVSPLPISTPGGVPFVIQSAHIGGYHLGSGINMTVTNVLLYNGVLSDTELEATSRTIAAAKRTDPAKTPKTPMQGNRLWGKIQGQF